MKDGFCEKVEYEEKTPLNFAAETGNIKIFEILLIMD